MKSGMAEENAKIRREKVLLDIIDRQSAISSLSALSTAFQGGVPRVELSKAALVIDASAFLRLGRYVDVVDYLNIQHMPPVILPGQAIQEFWNNYSSAHQAIATGIRSKFEVLKKEISKVDDDFDDFAERFESLISEFSESFGYAYDGETIRLTLSLFEALEDKAAVPYVRRKTFAAFSVHRNATKTPPGFKDSGDGDFFIWLDALEGLLAAKESGEKFESVVFVTNDTKLDWSRSGIPHPVLSAEMNSLLGIPLVMWNVKRLAEQIDTD